MIEEEKNALVIEVAKIISDHAGMSPTKAAVTALNAIADAGYIISKPAPFPRFYYETIVF